MFLLLQSRLNALLRRPNSPIWLTVILVAVLSPTAPSLSASTINLGSAADYAVVGVGGTVSIQSDYKLYQSATVINGNVAEGPHTTLGHGIDSTVSGRWDYDLTDANPAASGFTGTVAGGFHQLNLSGVAADARAATAAAAAFAPTQTFKSLSEGQNVIGNSGVNVIRITGNSTIKTTLSLTGTASSVFIFQFTSSTTAGHNILTLSGMNMSLIGGVLPNNIYWDFNGSGGDLSITSMSANQTVYGNFLAADRNILIDHGNIVGRVIGGGNGTLLSIHSGSKITSPGGGGAGQSGQSVPDAGGTLGLLVLGFGIVSLGKMLQGIQPKCCSPPL